MKIESFYQRLNQQNRAMADQVIYALVFAQENHDNPTPTLSDVDIFLADTDRLDRMAESVGATLKEEFRK